MAMNCSRFSLPATILTVALAGCAPRVGTVTGTVTFDGEKLQAGTVIFQGGGGSVIKTSPIAEDGTYKIEDFPVGPVLIAVVTRPAPLAMAGVDKNLPPPWPGMPPDDKAPRASVLPKVGKYTAIPDRYYKPETSGLGCSVEAGTHTHDLPLTP
jgi:hypothetical protein